MKESLICILFIGSLCSGCVVPSEELVIPRPEPLTMEELTSVMKVTARPQKIKVKSRGRSDLQACIRLVTKISPALAQLKEYLASNEAMENNPFLMSQLTPSHCSGPTYEKTITLATKALNIHNETLGIILPLTGEHAAFGKAVLYGIKTARAEKPKKNRKRIIIKDSTSTPQGSLHALAELVFYDQVSIVIGGLSLDEANAIAPYSDKLWTPMLLLNKDKEVIEANPYTLQIYPNEFDQAKALALESKHRGIESISILKPDNGKSDRIIALLEDFLEKQEISIKQELVYTPGNYESMDHAVAEITQALPEHRPEEYQELLKNAKEQAEEEGVPFNPKNVILSPKVEVDAIFLPDNFHMVRFFVKLFKYHGLEKIPLIGTHEWRSEELISPWDTFLEDSFFADFIGSYQEIPSKLQNEIEGSQYFVPAQAASIIDFRLIGYRAANIGLTVLDTPFLKRKYILRQLLRQSEDVEFFKSKKVFYSDRSSWWPIFVFSLGKENLDMISHWQQL
ncbi:MAG: ABC transporter substrate-binding protein [Oligoflexales bacterium]|nr:ABC transporter substrate-binding protein [Oligoflexales bacterium]